MLDILSAFQIVSTESGEAHSRKNVLQRRRQRAYYERRKAALTAARLVRKLGWTLPPEAVSDLNPAGAGWKPNEDSDSGIETNSPPDRSSPDEKAEKASLLDERRVNSALELVSLRWKASHDGYPCVLDARYRHTEDGEWIRSKPAEGYFGCREAAD